jgi:hypothetical protein
MPPQKNSGNKGAKRETSVSVKNRDFVQDFLEDTRAGDTEGVFVARVLKKMGNGRIQAFYVDDKGDPHAVQAVIRGSFRGRGKRSVWIEDSSIVLIAQSGIAGSAEYEVMALLSSAQIHDLRKAKEFDPRILARDITDADRLVSNACTVVDAGFEFEAVAEEDEVNIDEI